jgi:hypothetical protein
VTGRACQFTEVQSTSAPPGGLEAAGRGRGVRIRQLLHAAELASAERAQERPSKACLRSFPCHCPVPAAVVQ